MAALSRGGLGSEVRVHGTDKNPDEQKDKGGPKECKGPERSDSVRGATKRQGEEGTDRRRASQQATTKCNILVMMMKGKAVVGVGRKGTQGQARRGNPKYP